MNEMCNKTNTLGGGGSQFAKKTGFFEFPLDAPGPAP